MRLWFEPSSRRNPGRVGGVAPETVGVADAVLRLVVEHLVVAGLQQVNPHVAAVGCVVPAEYVVFRPDEAEAVEIVIELIVLDDAVPDFVEMYPPAESFPPPGPPCLGATRRRSGWCCPTRRSPYVQVADVVGLNAVVKAGDHAVFNGHVFAVMDPDAHAAVPFAVQRHARQVQHQAILADFDDGILRGRCVESRGIAMG